MATPSRKRIITWPIKDGSKGWPLVDCGSLTMLLGEKGRLKMLLVAEETAGMLLVENKNGTMLLKNTLIECVS
jgi:hypothetical protein